MAVTALAFVGGCGGVEPTVDTTGGGGGAGGGAGGAAPGCPPGHTASPTGGCMPVGVQGCAEAFVEQDGLCRPSMAKCPAGTFALPLEGCVPIDGPAGCGTGTWGNIADVPGTVWVDPGYGGADGDGSRDKPFATIAAALAVVAPGGRVALAAGTYAEPLTLTKPIEVVGRCPSLVAVSGTKSTPSKIAVVVDATGAPGAKLANLRLGGTGFGVYARKARLELAGVHLSGATDVAVFVTDGSELSLRHVLIEKTVSPSGSWGRGLDIADGSKVSVEASALFENRDVAILVAGAGTSVTVSQSLIEGTLPRGSDLTTGRGLDVMNGASASFDASALVGNHEVALLVSGGGTRATVGASLLSGTLARPKDLMGGRAADVRGGAALAFTASALSDNREAALVALDPGTTLTVNMSVVSRTLPQESDGAYGIGLGCALGATLELAGSVVQDCHTAGLLVGGKETAANITDAVVERVAPGRFQDIDPDTDEILATYDGVADGLVVAFDANATVTRALVRDCSRAGVLFHASGGALAGVVSHASRYGLVLQGAPVPDYSDAGNSFLGTEQDVLVDGKLPVPQAPPVPEE